MGRQSYIGDRGPKASALLASTCQPSYLYDILQVHQLSLALRSSIRQFLHVPYMSTDFGRRTFSYSSPTTWNSIHTSIKNCSSLYSFKRHFKVSPHNPAC